MSSKLCVRRCWSDDGAMFVVKFWKVALQSSLCRSFSNTPTHKNNSVNGKHNAFGVIENEVMYITLPRVISDCDTDLTDTS